MSRITTKHYHKCDDLKFVLEKIQQFSLPQSYHGTNKAFVYGGYIRDKLRGQPFTDMDISVPCLEVAEKFIQYLEQSSRLISLETRTLLEANLPKNDYQCFSMIIQTPKSAELKIDISYSWALVLDEDSLNNCDFTMNNLMMDANGAISTRVKAHQIGLGSKYNEIEWTAMCIRHCMEGKLVWMIPDNFSNRLSGTAGNIFMDKMNARLDKMLSKGFVLTGEHLTSFRLLKIRPISTLPQECDATICAVCQESYSDTSDKPTAVSKCSHHFHTICIKKWINKKIEEGIPDPKCPCCRQQIELYY